MTAPGPGRRSTGLRISDATMDRLRAAADERGLTLSYLAEHLLAEGIDELIPPDEFRLTRPRGQQP